MKELIHQVYTSNFRVHGARKVWRQLNRQGHAVARWTVERLMREEGIAGAVRGKKVITTMPGGQVERAPDRVERDFVAEAPNRCWVADFTYVETHTKPDLLGPGEAPGVPVCVERFAGRRQGWLRAQRSICLTHRQVSQYLVSVGPHAFRDWCSNGWLVGGGITAWFARRRRQGAFSSERSDVPHNHRLQRVPVYSKDRL
ncbi:IS3 family transposase [Streptomyces collinus]|uniref:IS3 family transposase n=1 Tax=Streptomyces collinus TaxID=42684 RepID=UPI00365B0FC5